MVAQEGSTNLSLEFHMLIGTFLNIDIFQELLRPGTASMRELPLVL